VLGEYGPAGRYHPTAFIRLLRPLRHPSLAASLEVLDGRRLDAEPVDCVVLERFWRFDVTLELAEELVREIRRRRARFLYAIDDNLLDLGADEPWADPVGSERRAAIRHFLRRADGVIVSTAALAARLRGLNERVVTVPNALDEQLFPSARARLVDRPAAATGPVVFGYMGTGTHDRDLLGVLEPLRAVLRKYRGEVELELAGVTKQERVRQALAGLPVRFLPIPTSDLYLDYVAWAVDHLRWDFGIAPLADTPANRCKSDIKFLDYAFLGIPGIFSRCEAYRDTVEHERTGLLCGPDPEEWQRALERLVEDSVLRSRLALAAHDAARPARSLALRAADWLAAIDSLCGP
jgi:glycosyltransferase involved in cell wall biosynthesis